MKNKQKIILVKTEGMLTEVDNRIELDAPEEKDTIASYVQLAKLLASEEVEDISRIVEILNKASFIEDDEIMYAGRSAQIYYKQLPIVINDEIKVKIVLLTQADSMALIIPEKVSETYEELKEHPESIIEVNKNLTLYAEVYHFNSTDAKLHDVIKAAYLSAGDSLRAFDIPKEVEDSARDDKEAGDDEDSTDNFDDMFKDDTGNDDLGLDKDEFDFEEPTDDVGDFSEFEENATQYKSFKNQTEALSKLVHKLYRKVDKDIREFVKVKYYGEAKSVLIFEVDNHAIFNKYKRVSKVAKSIMTAIGESIRLNKDTQLLDSFIQNNKRYFIVAEDVSNNFWVAKDDVLTEVVSQVVSTSVEPIQDEIIKLSRSSVRFEARRRKPFTHGGKIVFN